MFHILHHFLNSSYFHFQNCSNRIGDLTNEALDRLVKTDLTYALRPNGANAEIEVWPKISESLLTDKLADGWYLDNTDGFLSNYRGTISEETPVEPGEEEEEAVEGTND